MSAVNIVISIEGGIPNLIGAFDSYTRAGKSRRELIKKHNSPFTRQEIIERFKDNPGKFDEIWQKDSCDYLYDKDKDIYYPVSSENFDCVIFETEIQFGECS